MTAGGVGFFCWCFLNIPLGVLSVSSGGDLLVEVMAVGVLVVAAVEDWNCRLVL